MKNFFILLKYECYKLLVSPSTYFIAAAFLFILSTIYAFLLHEFILYDQEISFIHSFFQGFWVPVLLATPLLTMRTFSEDYKSKMMYVIKSTLTSDYPIIYAKFASIVLFYIVLWLMCSILIGITVMVVPSILFDSSFINVNSFIGGYIYILFSGLLFIAIGIFFSSLTENQVLAGIATFVFLFFILIDGQFLTFHGLNNEIINCTLVRPLNVFLQLDNACLGVVDTRVIVLYITLTLMLLTFTKVTLEKKFS